MTFEGLESSVESGQPIEVYKFSVGATEFRYTSAEDEQVVASQVYEPLALSRNQLLQSSEEREGIVEVELPGTNEFARLYVNIIPGRPTSLEVLRFHRTDMPTPEVIAAFKGYVQSVTFTKDGRVATVAARPHIAMASRPIPRFDFQGGCGNVLYDEFCKVDETDPAFRAANGIITAIVGKDVTVAGLSPTYSDGWFTGGFIEVLSPNDFRLIVEHTGDVLTLLMPFHADALGETVHVFSGCDHDVPACTTKFSNYLNYGGEPYIPVINPFKSGLV